VAKTKRSGSPAGAPFLLVLAVALAGSTATNNASISAAIVANCTITGSAVAFGNYDPIVTNRTAALTASASALSVACTRDAPNVWIALDTGRNGTHASGTTRAMASGTNYLSYELYTSAAMTTAWGTTNGTNTVTYSPTSMAATSFTVYGKIPGGQDAAAASYSDSVTATVNF
jgi:spore coat protein U-like protein